MSFARGAAALMAALALGAVSCGASAAGVGSYSARQSWEASAKAGDASARWALAWAYAEAGDAGRAWQWAQGADAEGEEPKVYLKAWLAWRAGRLAAVEPILEQGRCDSDRCEQLRVNALWDQEQWEQARDAALGRLRSAPSPHRLVLALTASLLAGDFETFDELWASVDWRKDDAFAAARAQLRALGKLRANF